MCNSAHRAGTLFRFCIGSLKSAKITAESLYHLLADKKGLHDLGQVVVWIIYPYSYIYLQLLVIVLLYAYLIKERTRTQTFSTLHQTDLISIWIIDIRKKYFDN